MTLVVHPEAVLITSCREVLRLWKFILVMRSVSKLYPSSRRNKSNSKTKVGTIDDPNSRVYKRLNSDSDHILDRKEGCWHEGTFWLRCPLTVMFRVWSASLHGCRGIRILKFPRTTAKNRRFVCKNSNTVRGHVARVNSMHQCAKIPFSDSTHDCSVCSTELTDLDATSGMFEDTLSLTLSTVFVFTSDSLFVFLLGDTFRLPKSIHF